MSNSLPQSLTQPHDKTPAAGFARLVEIMARLRAPDGCPWDLEQNFDTIKPYLLEETYEVLDAIDARDWPGLAEELGDLMLQAVFFSQMASEAGHFDINDALEAINSKMIRRHPHIFGDGDARTSDEVLKKWDEIKATEKARPKGLLAGVSRSQPALVEAEQIARKAAKSGFDWPNIDGVFDKLREELAELDEARGRLNNDAVRTEVHQDIEGELGDILFVIVNLARFLKVDPEQALRKTNSKFRRRFQHVEEGLESAGKSPKDATLDEMEALWKAAKEVEQSKQSSS